MTPSGVVERALLGEFRGLAEAGRFTPAADTSFVDALDVDEAPPLLPTVRSRVSTTISLPPLVYQDLQRLVQIEHNVQSRIIERALLRALKGALSQSGDEWSAVWS